MTKNATWLILALFVTGFGCGGRGPVAGTLDTALKAAVAADHAIDQLDTIAQERIVAGAPTADVGHALLGAYRVRRERVLHVLAQTYTAIAAAATAAGAGDPRGA